MSLESLWPPPPHAIPPAAGEQKPAAAFTFRPQDLVSAVGADPPPASPDPDLLDIAPDPGADEASTDDGEPNTINPTLAMIAGEESDDESWPAFASVPVWTPPLSDG
ncbi:hypothetical protein CYMTET_32575 [Cymbomonas tetramitiformis]|uniref:Uncharacterized protein n=1 Tax=Cymbomonas tetramitiformis TaxID=36881 RepID=A0AAE0FF20_9CHLO|nr:hypothetical protein CYMTET_32575 [Cymbomonas tetramitiformis]